MHRNGLSKFVCEKGFCLPSYKTFKKGGRNGPVSPTSSPMTVLYKSKRGIIWIKKKSVKNYLTSFINVQQLF